MIYHLLYISKASPKFNMDQELNSILDISEEKNKVRGVSGMLLKNGQFFIQLLEGKKSDVLSLYRHISNDPRHFQIKTLITYEDQSRLFPNWAMGLIEAEKYSVDLKELIPYLNTDIIKQEHSREKVISILRRFNAHLESAA